MTEAAIAAEHVSHHVLSYIDNLVWDVFHGIIRDSGTILMIRSPKDEYTFKVLFVGTNSIGFPRSYHIDITRPFGALIRATFMVAYPGQWIRLPDCTAAYSQLNATLRRHKDVWLSSLAERYSPEEADRYREAWMRFEISGLPALEEL